VQIYLQVYDNSHYIRVHYQKNVVEQLSKLIYQIYQIYILLVTIPSIKLV